MDFLPLDARHQAIVRVLARQGRHAAALAPETLGDFFRRLPARFVSVEAQHHVIELRQPLKLAVDPLLLRPLPTAHRDGQGRHAVGRHCQRVQLTFDDADGALTARQRLPAEQRRLALGVDEKLLGRHLAVLGEHQLAITQVREHQRAALACKAEPRLHFVGNLPHLAEPLRVLRQ